MVQLVNRVLPSTFFCCSSIVSAVPIALKFFCCPVQAPGNAQHTMHSQHGFHVKGSGSSSQFPTIKEASQAEESGDGLVPELWRVSCSPAAPVPRVGSAVTGLLGLCADSSMAIASTRGLQLPGSPVEVVGTAHSSHGIRRLVKAVVRGLRACQVPSSCLHARLICDGRHWVALAMMDSAPDNLQSWLSPKWHAA